MVKFYVRWIKQGKFTIDDVPERFKAQVQEELDKESTPA